MYSNQPVEEVEGDAIAPVCLSVATVGHASTDGSWSATRLHLPHLTAFTALSLILKLIGCLLAPLLPLHALPLPFPYLSSTGENCPFLFTSLPFSFLYRQLPSLSLLSLAPLPFPFTIESHPFSTLYRQFSSSHPFHLPCSISLPLPCFLYASLFFPI